MCMPDRTHKTAAILSIGDELTLGQKLDTNSKWLSEQLVVRGVTPILHVTVSDGLEVLTHRIVSLAADHDLVVMTGGLGPTADDLTRQALADAMGDALIEDIDALRDLHQWFEGRGIPMPGTNRVQAMRPLGARCLKNDRGTAPGLHGLVHGADVFCLPGPPSEMHPMFERDVVGSLRPEIKILTRVMPTVGMGESAIAQQIGELMDRSRNPLIGTTASSGVVFIRMRYEGKDETQGATLLDEAEGQVRELLGDHVISSEDRSLPEIVLGILKERGQTLATVESCTGGMIGQVLTGVPGSSVSYVGGFVTYSNEMKMKLVGVDRSVLDSVGAVSEECCRQLVRGGREHSGADYAVAVTGIAGPDGGSDEKPVGTVWIGVEGPGGYEDIRQFRLGRDREQIRRRTVTNALAMVWMAMTGKGEMPLLWEVPVAKS
ncbi:MAG: competence/damage-inducible protein A [Phycisphaerales bacterium]